MRNGEMICSECLQLQKQEMEYPYWWQRLTIIHSGNVLDVDFFYDFRGYKFKQYDLVEIKNGYQKNAPKLLFECKGISIGKPNEDWIGAKFDGKDDVFIIKLGDRV